MTESASNSTFPYFIGLNRRAMISLGPLSEKKYCTYGCEFCYVRGPFPKNMSSSPVEIIEWLKTQRDCFDIVYISGDTDSFAGRATEGLELLRLLVDFKVDVLFTTRYVFSKKETLYLKDIARSFKRNGNLLIGCISVCQLHHPKLEPKPIDTPQDRIKQLCTWKNIGITTVLAIRPLIKGISSSEYAEIVNAGSDFADVVLCGVLYLDTEGNIERQLKINLDEWNNDYLINEIPKQLDFTKSIQKWYLVKHNDAEFEISKACESKNIPFFTRSSPAIEYFKEYKKYFISQTNFKFFHTSCIASLTRQIETTNKFCKLPEDMWGADIKGLKEFIATHIPRTDLNPVMANEIRSIPQDGALIGDHFEGEFDIMQQELSILFTNAFGDDWKAKEPRSEKIISNDKLDDLRHEFGSVTAGLDAFVAMKKALLTQDKREVTRAEWITLLVARAEKTLRDLVCNTIYNVGAEPVVECAIIKIMKEFNISSGSSDRFSDTNVKTTAFYDEIANDFSKHMAKKTKTTFDLSRSFFRIINSSYMASDFRSRNNMCSNLSDLGSDEKEIINSILKLRDVALHERQFDEINKNDKSEFEDVVQWTQTRCRLIAQFINSLCTEYTLVALSSIKINERSSDFTSKLVSILSRKAQFEVRFFTLFLLKNNLYWLAWFLSEATVKFFETDKNLMLLLNAAYASKKISEYEDLEPIFDEQMIPELNNNWLPRYLLIQKSLLGHFSDIPNLMIKAIESGDMSIEELKSWPALEYLRETSVFWNTIAKLES